MTDRRPLTYYTQANRAAWNASADVHRAAPNWAQMQADAARPGFSVLDATLTQTLVDLGMQGRRVAQVGCNNARELLSLAALGAVPALGIDQSDAFLAQAQDLADAAGLAPKLLCADVYDLPADLGTYDLVLITIGVLNWMPDIARFFEVVAGLLAKDGVLVIYETHPVLEMFDPDGDDPFAPTISYFETKPDIDTQMITYDGGDHGVGRTSFWFQHTLGAIVTGVVQSGLQVVRLTEHAHSNREPDYDIYEGRAAQVPMAYTLVARR